MFPSIGTHAKMTRSRWRGWCPTLALGRPQQFQLASGGEQWVLLRGERTVADWVRLYERWGADLPGEVPDAEEPPGLRFTLKVRDQFDAGVVDTVEIIVMYLPIGPRQGSSLWRPRRAHIEPDALVDVRVQPTRRDYLPSGRPKPPKLAN